MEGVESLIRKCVIESLDMAEMLFERHQSTTSDETINHSVNSFERSKR